MAANTGSTNSATSWSNFNGYDDASLPCADR